ncbi:MAG: c-type cytochrome, partial [bacterium]
CHFGLDSTKDIHGKTPDLSFAGVRYNSAYLFEYLRNPTRVRLYLEAERMPDFRFDEKEALALTLFLAQQNNASELSGEVQILSKILAGGIGALSTDPRTLIKEIGCQQCHKLDGSGESKAVELANIGYRLNREWMQKYLVAPHVYGVPETRMPSPFFVFDREENTYTPAVQFAALKIKTIAKYLFSLASDKHSELQKAFERVKNANPDITAELGEKIFISQDCMACHRISSVKPIWEKNAPDLGNEGARVKREWLVQYLQKPHPLRPFGYYPGSSSRMPDFRLSQYEAVVIADALMKKKGAEIKTSIAPKQLSKFSMNKAHTLLQKKLSCLGCHRLAGEGGRIGPDLSSLSRRLQPEFVFSIIENPVETIAHPAMPKIAMPPKTRALIANYLIQQQGNPVEQPQISLAVTSPYFYQQKSGVQSLYWQHCAACHGLSGKGDGYNAAFMPTQPTKHADADHMSKRPDDTLFDGTYVGGYILNKNHFMPGFGQTLSREQIWELVAYMRKLCSCEQPKWARDNK